MVKNRGKKTNKQKFNVHFEYSNTPDAKERLFEALEILLPYDEIIKELKK